MTNTPKAEQLQSFREASRKYSDTSILMHEAIARKAGLSGTDHKYLGFILQQGQMTAGELAARTGLTTGAITGLIDRLEAKKLVQREFDKDDRRKVIIVANEKNAMKLIKPLFVELQTKTTKLLASFSSKEIQTIEKYFTAATEIMNDVAHNLSKE